MDNSAGPVWLGVTNISGIFSNCGGLLVPGASRALTYDADGNLTADGVWTYKWDGGNRLISMTMNSGVQGIASSNLLRLAFSYDYMGRRVEKIVFVWNGTEFTPQSTNLFVYDGWNLLAVVDPQVAVLQTFMWGQDLSGTETSAAGIGGLLMVTINGTNCFTGYDGNGNVTSLINATDTSVAARYEYNPYGNLLRETGSLARQNPFRFSTKFWDEETGIISYPSRFYGPSVGRWLNRDQQQENGGINLFAFANNNPIGKIDPLGSTSGSAGDETAAAGLGSSVDAGEGAADVGIESEATAVDNQAELESELEVEAGDSDALLNDINTVNDLISKSGPYNPVKAPNIGLNGQVDGDINAIFNDLIQGGDKIGENTYRMPNGDIITKYSSTKGNGPTLQINMDDGNGSVIFKIRVSPPKTPVIKN